jgi:hypothetical protein
VVLALKMSMRLTSHKISDREPGEARHAAESWMANTQKIGRALARGSLHRLVRPFAVLPGFVAHDSCANR